MLPFASRFKAPRCSSGCPIYEFSGPGDESNKLASTLSYAKQVTTVHEAATILNTYLQTLHGPQGGPLDVHFVAHSLGNRLLISTCSTFPAFPS